MRNPTDALPDNPIHTPPAPPRMPRHTQRARFRTEPSSIRNIHRITHAGTYATCVIPHRTVPNPTDPPVEQVSSIPIRLILYVTAYAAAQSRCGTITNRPSGRQARPTVRGSAHTATPRATPINPLPVAAGHHVRNHSHTGTPVTRTRRFAPHSTPPCEDLLTQRARAGSGQAESRQAGTGSHQPIRRPLVPRRFRLLPATPPKPTRPPRFSTLQTRTRDGVHTSPISACRSVQWASG